MRWMRHRTIILVSAIIYFKCIIATTIIAMVYYNYHTRFHIPTVVVVLHYYYYDYYHYHHHHYCYQSLNRPLFS